LELVDNRRGSESESEEEEEEEGFGEKLERGSHVRPGEATQR
jgi:hypothetical protein